ncbi:ABC1 domain containing [Cordyceps militaris]|uniref:Protein YAE1 n=1 Tax=Cordyceps militaris TaxID=73501 RepID=A0A2H4SDM0_CORMI|nr:ABC1 domain containing [Cordyceps militaris]
MHQQARDLSAEDSHFSQGRHQADEIGPDALVAAPSDPLDDVFGADDAGDDDAPNVVSRAPESTHPTDMSRLQAEHSTSGYREGVSVAKEASIQPGFDEGFSLGATIGQRAGHLIGLVEGISNALEPLGSEESADAARLLSQAREELSTRHIFSADYWAPDGNWTYPVNNPRDTGGEVLFSDVAEAHPLISKWTAIVDEQVQRWHIQLDILRDEAGPRVEVISDEQARSGLVQKTNKALDW